MNRQKIKFKIKKIGNHWYPDLPHNFLTTPMFSDRTEHLLNIFNKHMSITEEYTIELEEVGIIVEGADIIYFNEEDLLRFFTTEDDFYVRFTVNGREYAIHSDFYNMLDTYFEFNKYDEYYQLHLH